MRYTTLLGRAFILAGALAATAPQLLAQSDSTTLQLPSPQGSGQATLYTARPLRPGVQQGVFLMISGKLTQHLRQAYFASSYMQGLADSARITLAWLQVPSDTVLTGYTGQAAAPDTLIAALGRLGRASGQPELANNAWVVAGIDKGAALAQGLAYARPERTLAVALVRPRSANRPSWAAGPLTGIPIAVLAGELAGPEINQNRALPLDSLLRAQAIARRAQSELIHWANQYGATQRTFSLRTAGYLAQFAFFSAVLRLPPGADPTTGPVTLSPVPESIGVLAQAQRVRVFVPSNFVVAPIGGALPTATSGWLPGPLAGQAWMMLHASSYDSLKLNPLAQGAFPYCSGQRPQTVSARYVAARGVTFLEGNVFRLEVSSISGDFDDPRYGGRTVGTLRSTAPTGTINSIRLPDNIDFNNPIAPGTPNRYRIRITSTNPETESVSTAEIASFRNCPLTPADLVSSIAFPLQTFYYRGDRISFVTKINPTLTANPGDFMRIQLSDTNGIFRGVDVQTRILDSVPAIFVGDSITLSATLPADVVPAYRYRIRAVLSSNPAATSTSTGHDISILGQRPESARRSAIGRLAVYPNPAGRTIQVQLPAGARILEAEAISLTGQLLPLQREGTQLSTATLAPGTYTLRVRTASGVYTGRFVRQ